MLLTLVALPVSAESTDPGRFTIDPELRGQEVIEAIGPRINQVAELNRMTPEELSDLLLRDPSVAVAPTGKLAYFDPGATNTQVAVGAPAEAIAPLASTFLLNSKPGSQRTIYLDFNGHNLTNTLWNDWFDLPNNLYLPPYSIDANSAFSNQELANIQNIWARIAEDYAPFDVNVTTQDPGYAAINRNGPSDQVFGTRIVMTNASAEAICGWCGGVAFVGVFDDPFEHDYYQPALCFTGNLGGGVTKYAAECMSHEVGHNLGLDHDGTASLDYYSGHGVWAPIMGTGYDRPISQWSKGEYSGASNTEDDFYVMSIFGLPIRADDHGNNPAGATEILANTSTPGIIASQSDSDYFTFFATANGSATWSINPATVSPNLDISATLYGPNGTTVIQTSNPAAAWVSSDTASGLAASITANVTAGTVYYLKVEGSGHLSASTGYTRYGSVGQYTVNLVAPEGAMNDNFADSIVLPGNGGSTAGTNQNATGEGSEPGGSCFSDAQVNSAWWHWTPTISGEAVIDTFRSNFNTNLVVYTGSSLGSLSQVACNNDSSGTTQSRVVFSATAGTTYRIRIDGAGAATGRISIGYRVRTQSDSVGLVNPATGEWSLRDPDSGRTTSFYYGVPGDLPFMGDWNGDGIATPGLYRQSTGFVYLRDSNDTGPADLTFHFGIPGDIPLIGDFNGNGRDTVSVYRPSTGQVFIMNSLPAEGGSPVADISYFFGNPGDKPYAGDFNGDGIDTVGLHRESTGLVYFRNSHTQGNADAEFFYGIPADFILAGKWHPLAGNDTVAIFRPSTARFYLRFDNSQGFADREYGYGSATMRPVYGYFGNLLGASTPPPGTP